MSVVLEGIVRRQGRLGSVFKVVDLDLDVDLDGDVDFDVGAGPLTNGK